MSDERQKLHEALNTITPLRVVAESMPCYLQILGDAVAQSKDILQDPVYSELVDKYCSPTLKFSYAALYLLQKLVDSFSGDPVEDLLSASQQIKIRILLQMLFSLGVQPCLKPSVNVPLLAATRALNLYKEDNDKWPLKERNDFLAHAVLQLISLLKTPNLRSQILEHLGGLLSALLQLIHCKSKKTTEATEPVAETFTDEQRERFLQGYEELSEGIYKPLLIKELLILLIPKRDKSIPFPRWLEGAIIHILTGYLTKPGGVATTIRACCPSNTEDVNWVNVVSLAKLISNVHNNINPDRYYSLISPQVISLLHATGPYCLPVAKMCIKSVLEKDSVRCDQYFFRKLFEPFILCSKPLSDQFNGTLVSETLISRCINNISKCFNQQCTQSDLPIRILSPIVKIKFNLYMKICGTNYQHTGAVEQLLIRYLMEKSDYELYDKVFGALLFDEPHDEMLEMNPDLKFEFESSGSIHVMKNAGSGIEQDLSFLLVGPQIDCACQSVMTLFKNGGVPCHGIMFQLFLYLLQTLAASFGAPTDEPNVKVAWKKKEQQLFTVKMLVELSENETTMQFIKNKSHVLGTTINMLLQRYLKGTYDQQGVSVSLLLPLRLLDIITCDWQPGSEKWKTVEPTIEHLKNIIDICPNECKQTCTMIYHRLLTEGSVKNISKSPDQKPKKKSNDDNDLDSIIEMLRTSDVCTRGNGLIMLKKYFRTLYPDVVARKDEIFVLLKDCLNDPDSYVYLAAIAAFEAVVDVYGTEVVEHFCSVILDQRGYSPLQLKIGEILVRLTRICEQSCEVLPTVIATFFQGTKSEDELLRASCLSNLGETFKYFKFLSGCYIHRMITCIQSILATDKSNVVRRAAALAGHLAIQGDNKNLTKEMQGALLELYRTMRHVHQTDNDAIVRLHAGTALQDINQLIKEDLTRSLPLEKKISILSIDH